MEQRKPNIEPEVVSWEMVAVLREMTTVEKFECVSAMYRIGRNTAIADLRRQHPAWKEIQVSQELARRVAAGEHWVPEIVTEMVENFFRPCEDHPMPDTFHWLDVQRIAEELADAHTRAEPYAVTFVDLRAMVEALDGFAEQEDHPVNERILEEIQRLWHEEIEDLHHDGDSD